MTSHLHIKLSHDTSCSHRVGQILVIHDNLAESLRIKPGKSEVAVNYETPDFIKITYRGKVLALNKTDILELF